MVNADADYKNTKLIELFKTGRSETHPKGYLFAAKPESNMSMTYYLVNGYIKVSSVSHDGDESIHIIYGKGDIFPLLPLLGVYKEDIIVTALTHVKVYGLPRDEVLNNTYNHSPYSTAILERLLIQFSVLIERLENFGHKTARDRLIHRLLVLAARFGSKQGTHIYLDKVFTQKLIGSTISLRRETVTREFDKLRKQGLVDTNNHQIRMLNPLNMAAEIGEQNSEHFSKLRGSAQPAIF